MIHQAIEAELTWTGRAFEPGIRVGIGVDGRIASSSVDETPRQLPRRALLPGMTSAHSHAFQRALRGSGEHFPAGAGSFWSWREAMYALVEHMDEREFLTWCTRTFREMLRAGITSVGEFHYFHHSRAAMKGTPDWKLDELVLEAARDAGIRIVLLQAYYRDGGIGKPPSMAQRRFFCDDQAAFWKQIEQLDAFAYDRYSIGIVAHSIRAVDPGTIASLHEEACRRAMPFHMHLDEQRQEIADCIAAYGAAPTRLLLDRLDIGSEFTSVHATHTATRELEELMTRGANVCIAPLTEGNLGDGFPLRPPLLAHRGQISIGTDSNARISMLEELRMLEYAHRLKEERRGVWRSEWGAVGATLFSFATTGGARSLGLPCGEIREGQFADLLAIDLDHPSLAGISPEALMDAWILGAPDDTIREVCVGGVWQTVR